MSTSPPRPAPPSLLATLREALTGEFAEALHIVGLFVVALGLRLWGLPTVDVSLYEAREVLAAVLIHENSDLFNPLGPLASGLYRIIMRISGSALYVRLLSGLVGALMVLPVYRVLRDLGNQRAGFYGGLFVAVSPLLVDFSRMSSSALLQLVASIAALRFLVAFLMLPEEAAEDRPIPIPSTVLPGILAGVFGFVAYRIVPGGFSPAFLLLPAVLVYAPRNRRGVVGLVLAVWPLALTLGEWYQLGAPPFDLAQRHSGALWWSFLPDETLFQSLSHAAFGLHRPYHLQGGLLLVGAVLPVLALFGLRAQWRLGVVLLSALLLTAGGNLYWYATLQDTAALPAIHVAPFLLPLTCLLMLAALGLGSIDLQSVPLMVVVGYLFLSLPGPRDTYLPYRPSEEEQARLGSPAITDKPYRRVARAVGDKLRKGDLVCHTSTESMLLFQYYFNFEFRGRLSQYTLDHQNLLVQRYMGEAGASGRAASPWRDHERELNFWGRIVQANAITHEFTRVWLVESWWGTSRDGAEAQRVAALKDWLAENYRYVDTLDIGGVPVSRYVVRNVIPSTEALNWDDRPALLRQDNDFLDTYEPFR